MATNVIQEQMYARAPVPDVIGFAPCLCICQVITRNNDQPPDGDGTYPDEVGYAAGLTYDVLAQTPNGLIPFDGVAPKVRRWTTLVWGFSTKAEDEESSIDGSWLIAGIMNRKLYIFTEELPYFGPCTPNNGDSPHGTFGGSPPLIVPGGPSPAPIDTPSGFLSAIRRMFGGS